MNKPHKYRLIKEIGKGTFATVHLANRTQEDSD